MLRPFTGHNPAVLKSFNVIPVYFELFRKLYAKQEYFEVSKMWEEFILTIREGENYSLEVFLLGRALLEDIPIQWRRYQ